jgi:hypothetical protein
MSDHQETLAQVVKRIEVSFVKERGAYYDAVLRITALVNGGRGGRDDLRNPNHPLHRPAPEQAVQP